MHVRWARLLVVHSTPEPASKAAAYTCAPTCLTICALQSERLALQWAAWEKQQKEIAKQQELIQRLSGGAQSGRASQAEKALERIKAEGLIAKPFVPKSRSFTFPPVEKMGQKVGCVDGGGD
jgi:ATPase subunit of ABC transporter with duplicated ATPase domains